MKDKLSMKRIGIFAFFDGCGIVDDYKLYLLDSLNYILSEIIIIINGFIQEESLARLYDYTNHIYIRENMGFDAGAYKDILMGNITCIEWDLWDEIILLNDTFYGPLYPWEEIFLTMDKEILDFWGFSRFSSGKLWDGSTITQHIQAYFIAVRKSMFSTLQWKKFWEGFEYPSSYMEAIKKFEISFTDYFSKEGFCYSTWMDKNDGESYIKENLNPYMEFAYDLVKYCRFPIVKYRACSVVRYSSTKALLNYIENNTDYDKRLILKHVERMDKEMRLKPFGISELKQFVNSHNRIFIFGHGKYGKGLEEYFQEKGWKISGFIMSVPNSQHRNEIALQDIEIRKTDGLIVAVANGDEIRPVLNKKFEDKQLLFARF
ncbi:MAG: hypothetical protein HFG54_04580 [Lachnospiraceae bacterium]|jgi:lipopolysaccharide biosynthesis protein|nr:hypothetical protein [Lachnospiraceae bacterium]